MNDLAKAISVGRKKNITAHPLHPCWGETCPGSHRQGSKAAASSIQAHLWGAGTKYSIWFEGFYFSKHLWYMQLVLPDWLGRSAPFLHEWSRRRQDCHGSGKMLIVRIRKGMMALNNQCTCFWAPRLQFGVNWMLHAIPFEIVAIIKGFRAKKINTEIWGYLLR